MGFFNKVADNAKNMFAGSAESRASKEVFKSAMREGSIAAGKDAGAMSALNRNGLITARQAMMNPLINSAGMAGGGAAIGAANLGGNPDSFSSAKNGAMAGALIGGVISGGRLAGRLKAGKVVGSESISALKAGASVNQLRKVSSFGDLISDGRISRAGERIIDHLGGNLSKGLSDIEQQASRYSSRIDTHAEYVDKAKRGMSEVESIKRPRSKTQAEELEKRTNAARGGYNRRVDKYNEEIQSASGWKKAHNQVMGKFSDSVKDNHNANNSWMGATLNSMNQSVNSRDFKRHGQRYKVNY